MNKKGVRIYLLFAFLFVFYMFVLKPISERSLREEFILFNNANITGRVVKLNKGKVSVDFSVDSNSATTYSVHPINTGDTGSFENTFAYLITVGDTVSKRSNLDTLSLYKRGKVHKFKFKRFI